ncbi:MAG: homocysteine S-methyltransferase family protein [Faecalibacterium sp.]|nr:homocysteine S-methyltransferase family protein [Ruminococcus sp.]MCM1391143.1 homocysteine S-methyltransferase family protein [Ruminococcus sp.]MCM1486231.1 homocysteine S-methyltransferase family protein [Faecalibacterium sp.]
MSIKDKLGSALLYFDGGMGTLLQAAGLKPGELPENWNISHSDIITNIHLDYLKAGSNIISANTFGANCLKFDNLDEIIEAAIGNARKAIELFDGDKENCFVAFDMGPLGKMLKPLGDLDFEDAVSIFEKSVKIASESGADLILIETMNDMYETKAAVLAAKENCDLPIFVTNAYDENGRLMTGADPVAVIAMLEGLRVDAIGVNCSLGPHQMKGIVETYCDYSSLPVIVNPNAGMPKSIDGKTVYDVDAEEFSCVMQEFAEIGVCVLGGCCGTTPEYIKKTAQKTENLPFTSPSKKNHTLISSYTHAVEIGGEPVLIGERINPTGKPKFKAALRENNIDYIISEGIAQQEKGVHVLDVNVGLPEIDECAMMVSAVTELQAVLDLPLQIDTVKADAMEKALRIYNGKPLINSVNAKEESMKEILPLAKKYGGVLIALTIDEAGIPNTAEGRYLLAKRIVDRAAGYGIDKKDIVVDPLAMTISSDDNSAKITLDSIRLIKEKLGVKTSLGVSNISFGLPNRDDVNSVFLANAFNSGLDCAIMNPYSVQMMKAYHCFLALNGMDKGCTRYIDFASNLPAQTAATQAVAVPKENDDSMNPLMYAIVKGLKQQSFTCAEELLKDIEPMQVINEYIIPALDIVGERFEKKTMFLPQLLMSAEAAGFAFDAVKSSLKSDAPKKDKIVLATVKGDIHDIGKNIVKVLLQNYGYDVIDLGKDVPPETVVDAAEKSGAKLVGLSALMTTTVESMEITIKMLKEKLPDVKTVVGGAVLTKEYADMIHADHYAKDAMETVRFAEKFFGLLL